MSIHKDRVVIGASAGGLKALEVLVAGLRPGLGAAVFVVLHVAPTGPSLLADILRRHTELEVIEPEDGAPIVSDRIYVARPNHHLLIEGDRIRVTRGPKENRHRPSVDALFRSAALYGGARTIGVVLTGNLDDGTAGLFAIKERGGTAVVQQPTDAAHPSMPSSALRYVDADHVVPLAAIAPLLHRLTRETAVDNGTPVSRALEIEAATARGENALKLGVMGLGTVSPFTCPECHGVLVAVEDGGVPRYRCHTGHAFSIETLLTEVTGHIEDALWGVLRGIEESVMLLGHLSAHLREKGDLVHAEHLDQRIREAQLRADRVREIVMNHEVVGLAP